MSDYEIDLSHVFISYAEEDSKVAHRLAEQFELRGCSVYYFEDPQRRGGIILENLADEIKRTNIFLVLLSPYYLESEWCKAEFEVGFHFERESRTKGREFTIHVLKIGAVEPDALVFERIYDWVDLTGEEADRQLKDFMDRILVRDEGEESTVTTQIDWLPFRNREQELEYLKRNLQNVGGLHYFLLVSAPKMGKSWLLHQLGLEMFEEDQRWLIQHVDLLENRNAWSDFAELLAQFNFAVDANGTDLDTISTQAARQISRSERFWLLMLDNGEYLGSETAAQLRTFLGTTKQILERRGLDARIAFVAASRLEIDAFKGILPKPTFETMALTPFPENAIFEVIKDAAKGKVTQPDAYYWDLAERLLTVTEGLPALLVHCLDWIRDEWEFVFDPEEIQSEELLDEIVSPYIKRTLLSAESLIPFWPDPNTQKAAREFWERFVLSASAFRIVSRSHVALLPGTDLSSIPSASDASPDLLDLFGKLPIVMPTQAMWHRIDPAIRRLLFRYQYRSDQRQLQEHETNTMLYYAWIADVSGTDAVNFVVESFWHKVESVRLKHHGGGVDAPGAQLEEFLIDLCSRENLKPDGFSHLDLVELVRRLISNDRELSVSLEAIDRGLKERVLGRLNELKEGGSVS